MDDQQSSFDTATVQKVFKKNWKNDNTKITKNALQLSAEFLRLFVVVEAVHRSSEEQDTINMNTKKLDTEHLERILPQLLLDF
ncbi:centromere protein X-like protein [Pilaira anomala]|nr:centromere protein X-like protein [Pilaira anomala]